MLKIYVDNRMLNYDSINTNYYLKFRLIICKYLNSVNQPVKMY